MFEDMGVICAVPVVILAVVCLSLVREKFKEVCRFQETLPTAPRSVISTSSSLIHDVEKALLLGRQGGTLYEWSLVREGRVKGRFPLALQRRLNPYLTSPGLLSSFHFFLLVSPFQID